MNHRRIDLLVWWVLGQTPPATALPPEIQTEVSWISEDELAQRGTAAIRELPEGDRLAVESMLRGARVAPAEDPDACDVTGKHGAPDRPVDAVSKLKKAKYAFLGRVVEKEVGLSHGSPATLYTVEVDRLLRWAGSEREPEIVYLLRHYAAVEVVGLVLCSESLRAPHAPEVGKEILVITDVLARFDPTLILPLNEDRFFETSEGYASIPGSRGALDLRPWELLRRELLEEAR